MPVSVDKNALELTWLDDVAAGYVDILPRSWFASDADGVDALHAVRGPKGREQQAICRRTVSARRVTLDYDLVEFRNFNEKNGIIRGVLTLDFADSSRISVKTIHWNGERCSKEDVQWKWTEWSPADPQLEDEPAFALVMARAVQAGFKALLLRVYEGACCISNCKVLAVLEAVHIRPFAEHATNQNHANNGLLMRSDLHVLFDRGLLAINPKGVVRVAPEARTFREYAELDGKSLRKPGADFLWAAPDLKALEARWKAFAKQWGQ